MITGIGRGPSHYCLPKGVSYLTEHSYQAEPVSESVLEYGRKRGIAGQPCFINEFGYGGLKDIDWRSMGRIPKSHRGLQGLRRAEKQVEGAFVETARARFSPDVAALRESCPNSQANAHKFTVESFRSNPRVGGFNVVKLFDSNSNEIDGLVDFWRNKRKSCSPVF